MHVVVCCLPVTALLQSNRSRAAFRTAVLRWYDANKRDLPWRQAPPDPYRVWISEVMLQQTRVAAVLGYYERFVQRFPNIGALAAACEQDVLTAWSGLGYYRRARMLHQAATQIVRDSGGHIPCTSQQLLELPGVGRYTAAAVASIAFQEPAAVVDGNVERILLRLKGDPALRGQELWSIAESLLATDRPGDFNQGMMELGATLCLPRDPHCGRCPIRRWCAIKGEHAGKPSAPRQRGVLSYAISRRHDSIRLVQRKQEASRMALMWELPMCAAEGTPAFTLRHSITISDYLVSIYILPGAKLPGQWIPLAKIDALPLTGLTRKALRRAQLLSF
jgi:A/G-specific adenine glycosylase